MAAEHGRIGWDADLVWVCQVWVSRVVVVEWLSYVGEWMGD